MQRVMFRSVHAIPNGQCPASDTRWWHSGFQRAVGVQHRKNPGDEIPFTIELFELSGDAHDQSRFGCRKPLTLLGREAWLPTAENVVIQKLRWCKGARRGKDFDDAVAVMGVQGEKSLDWPNIEYWCALHAPLDVLAAEAAVVWEADQRENAPE